MSTNSVMSACWPLQLPPPAKAVLIALSDWSDRPGHACYMSIATLCRRTCYKRTAVIASIAWLERSGYLVADRDFGRRTRYTVMPQQADLFIPLHKCDEPVRQTDQSATRTSIAPVDNFHKSVSKPVDKYNVTGSSREPVPVRLADPISGKAIKSFRAATAELDKKVTKQSSGDRSHPVAKSAVEAFARRMGVKL
jgi:hypothetical protein